MKKYVGDHQNWWHEVIVLYANIAGKATYNPITGQVEGYLSDEFISWMNENVSEEDNEWSLHYWDEDHVMVLFYSEEQAALFKLTWG